MSHFMRSTEAFAELKTVGCLAQHIVWNCFMQFDSWSNCTSAKNRLRKYAKKEKTVWKTNFNI